MAYNNEVGKLAKIDIKNSVLFGNVMKNYSPAHYNDYKVCMIPYTSPTPNAPASDICCKYYNYFNPTNASIIVPQPPGSFKVTEDCPNYPPQLWPAKPPAGWVPVPPPRPSPPSKHNNSLAIGLGVGLGLGIPLIFLVLFLIIRRKRQPKSILITS